MLLAIVGPVSILLSINSPCIAQEVRRSGFEPIDDVRFEVIEQFYSYDSEYPLDARVVETFETSDGAIEKVVFTASNGERVPGYLSLPADQTLPVPFVLLIHGLNSDKDWWWDKEPARTLTHKLIEAGFGVFAIDLQLHGERSSENDYQSAMYLTFENTLFIRNRDMMIQSTIDCRRALDYLRSRSQVDADRIGLAGYSMGAMISLYLSVLEPGLAAVSANATPSHMQLLPVDHYNFAARASLPILIQAGSKDWHTSEQDTRTLFELIPSGEKDIQMYESGHQLPSEYATRAADWLIQILMR